MLTQAATPEMLKQWQTVWHEYKDKLSPNRKTGDEIVAYLTAKYPIEKCRDEETMRVVSGTVAVDESWTYSVTDLRDEEIAHGRPKMVIDDVLLNDYHAEKLPEGKQPAPVVFFVENKGAGALLYQEQDEMFRGEDIWVGIDLTSGYYRVDGSSLLWDELCAFQGLDEADRENCFCVAEYISALEKFGLLDEVVAKE
jgi:hypothetical protein